MNLRVYNYLSRQEEEFHPLTPGFVGMYVTAKNPEWIDFWEGFKKERGLPKFKMFKNLEED